ncbi:SLOG family protein [Kibdelosporangium phytohabitans]|uniref:YspA cpYpsA-related SLOG domain-containing protein n=1 Tax=Kibdelosporangium phytohabitans TaxID=860235 RepID=A0A0N9HT18_9PSEU|nr:SLOG family protein [Kibdelosporangium phytohabitans]ALG06349.1 hypothetical protein AOZ06_04910 [Kibdelosporangium phytohabitans]MBE1467488.1 hypothetical protein [Kibdelosporangium phytohabitans]
MLITGSREWTDTTVIRDALASVWHPKTILMSGKNRRGADAMCEGCWKQWGGRVDCYPAQWYVDGEYRPSAGFRRNEEMVQSAVNLGAERCLAFIVDGSPGATHAAELARAKGIWTTFYRATSQREPALSSQPRVPGGLSLAVPY